MIHRLCGITFSTCVSDVADAGKSIWLNFENVFTQLFKFERSLRFDAVFLDNHCWMLTLLQIATIKTKQCATIITQDSMCRAKLKCK